MKEYKHIWGQGWIDYAQKDLATLKLRKCLEAINAYFPGHRGKILEIGCGAGRFIRSLQSLLPGFEYAGCDVDGDAIRLAASYKDSIQYRVGDAIALPYADTLFDMIILIDTLEHIENTDRFLEEIRRITRKGSILHIYVPCEGEPWTLYWLLDLLHIGRNLTRKHAGHFHKFTKQEVIECMKAHQFEVLTEFHSTYLMGQIMDLLFYALQEIPVVKARLLTAHAYKDKKDEPTPWFTLLTRKIINMAFYIGYLESISISKGFLSQGLHLSCRRQ